MIKDKMKKLAGSREVWLWGAGEMGKNWLRVFSAAGVKVAGFLSTSAAAGRETCFGYPHRAAGDYLKQPEGCFIFISATPRSEGEIVRACRQAGLIRYRHFLASSDLCGLPLDDESRLAFAPPDVVSVLPPPPNLPPAALAAAYAEVGPLFPCYINNSGGARVHNTTETYARLFEDLKNRSLQYYGQEVLAFYDLLDRYDFQGRTVLVWGLAGCNCEGMALWRGAERVYVVDYNKPVCDHPRVTVLNHEELSAKGLRPDLAFSFSSFEHDGLGQYGDPLDPDGDFKAMRAARENLKDGGLLFLGLPLGRECLVWNLHRIYGPRRLAVMLRGWFCEDVINPYERMSPDFPFDRELGQMHQPILVLRKEPDGRPNLDRLAGEIQKTAALAAQPRTGLRDFALKLRIQIMQAEDLAANEGAEVTD